MGYQYADDPPDGQKAALGERQTFQTLLKAS